MKRAVVCGAGGFIGGHLVERLKKEGLWVRGVDIKQHEFRKTAAEAIRRLSSRGVRRAASMVDAALGVDRLDGDLETRVFGLDVELAVEPSGPAPGARWAWA